MCRGLLGAVSSGDEVWLQWQSRLFCSFLVIFPSLCHRLWMVLVLEGGCVSCYSCGRRWGLSHAHLRVKLETGVALVPRNTALSLDTNQIPRFHKPA